MTKPIQEGFHSITPHLVVTDAQKALEWYQKALGAKVLSSFPMPDGKLMHAELKFGDSVIMVAETCQEMGQKSPKELGGSPVVINFQMPDCDRVWNQAVAAGATIRFPLGNQFWGDRYGQLADPFGHVWGISTHLEDVPPQEMEKRAKAAMAEMGKG